MNGTAVLALNNFDQQVVGYRRRRRRRWNLRVAQGQHSGGRGKSRPGTQLLSRHLTPFVVRSVRSHAKTRAVLPLCLLLPLIMAMSALLAAA
jgi:hypothetical protein